MLRQGKKLIGMLLAIVLFVTLYYVSPAEASVSETVYDVTISSQDEQTVKGWGVFPAWNRSDWTRHFIDKTGAQEALYEDLGVTLFRVMIPVSAGDGDGNLVFSRMQEMSDLIQNAHSYGQHDYMISVWSPPVGMKTHPTVNGWTGTEHVRLLPEKEETYANYLVDAIEWLIADGASAPKAISFQNEPLSMIMSEWCYWGGENGQQFQRFAKLLRSKLDQAGLNSVQLLAPEGAAYRENEELLGHNFEALAQDPELEEAIDGFASHSYISRDFGSKQMLEGYKQSVDRFPDKDRWQTEYSSLVSGMSQQDMALDVSRRLISDMAYIQNNYWFWWLGWDHARTVGYVGEVLLEGDGYTVEKSKAFHLLSKVFNEVEPGSKVRRVTVDPASGLTSEDELWMDTVAFVDGDKTVLLLVNPNEEAKKVNIHGLTGNSADIFQMTDNTAETDGMIKSETRNIVGSSVTNVQLPPASITVLTTTSDDKAPPLIVFDQQDSSSVTDATYAVRSSTYTVTGQLDEPGILLINGEVTAVAGDLSFSKAIQLEPGVNEITAQATDGQNNTSGVSLLSVRHDPAYIGLTLDQSAYAYVNNGSLTISGVVNDDSVVTVRHYHDEALVGQPTYHAVLPTGELLAPFQVELQLLGGENTIEVQAVNASEQQAEPRTLVVVYDTDAPVITAPVSGSTTFGSYVVRGSVSEPAMLRVNGERKELAGDLTFAIVVPVTDGVNVIQLEAEDMSGNTSTRSVEVTADLLPDGALAPGVILAGSIEHGAAMIDGNLDEPHWVLNQAAGKLLAGKSDNAVYYGTAWDETNLYVGIHVIDVHTFNDSARAYEDDSVEIYIDGNNGQTGTYGSEDHQITLGWQDSELAVGKNIAGIQFAQQNTTDGYTVEFAIPWDGIGIDPPTVGAVIGFDIGNNDDDGNNNGNRQGQLMWHGDLDNWSDTSAFGSLLLNDARHTAIAPAAGAPVVINGYLNEASWSITEPVERTITGVPVTQLAFGALSDNDHLYVGIDVTTSGLDEALLDQVELFIDIDSASRGTDNEQIRHVSLQWGEQAVGGDVDGIHAARNVHSGGYTLELAIPWNELGVTASRDLTLGFDILHTREEISGTHVLSWNSAGNPHTTTADYGNLLLHNAGLPDREYVVVEPPGLRVFRDQGRNLSKLEDKSDHIVVVGWDPQKFNGDADRIGHSNDNPITPEYIVYKSPHGDIFSFEILTGRFDNTPGFKFYTSVDGVNFSQINPESKLVGGQQSYSVRERTSQRLGAGTRYLKIEYPGTANWHAFVLDVMFKYVGDETKGEWIDKSVDFSKLYRYSPGIRVANYEPAKFGGDAHRFKHVTDNPETPEYVEYRSPDGDILGFEVETALYQGTPPFEFYGSSDGDIYEQLTVTTTVVGTGSGYAVLHNAPAEQLPSGIRYLKIQFPGAANWHEYVNRTVIEYEITEQEPDVTLQEYTDEAVDLSKLYEHSANIVIADYNPDKFGGDADRFKHSNSNPIEPEFVIYRSPGSDLTTFRVDTARYQGTPPFTFYGSADGVNYEAIEVSATVITSGQGYAVHQNVPAAPLEEGIRYLKIQFPGMANWHEYINRVVFTYETTDEGEEPGELSAQVILSGDETASPGHAYELLYGLDEIEGHIVAQNIALTFDPQVMEFVTAESLLPGTVIAGQESNDGSLQLVLASEGVANAIVQEGDILRLLFQIREEANEGGSAISITTLDMADAEGVEAVIDGTVKVVTIVAVDTAALTTLIADAQSLYDASEGTGEYPTAARVILLQAIDDARLVADEAASQQIVDQAVVTLSDAISQFLLSELAMEDLNRDGRVSIADLALVVIAFGQLESLPNWDDYKAADLNDDGKVDALDFAIVASIILE